MTQDEEAKSASLHFGGFSLDRRRWRLMRGGEEISVQPRVLEVLAYLAERSGRVVSKKELFGGVWKDGAVGDAALARAISEARKALGDSARDPRYLMTVHGQGYRFLEPVRIEEADPAVALPVSMPEPKEARALPRWIRRCSLVLLVATLVGFSWWLFLNRDHSLVLPEPLPALRIGLLPFSEGDDGAQGRFQAPPLELLVTDLISAGPSRTLRSTESLIPLGYEEGSLQEIAERGALDILLTGRLRTPRPGETQTLDLEMHEFDGASTPRTVRAAPLSLPSPIRDHDLPTLVKALQERLAETLPPLRFDLAAAALPPVPNHLETLRLRLLSQRWLGEGTCQLEPVLEVLDAAKRLDPRYEPILLATARTHFYLAAACGLHPRHGEEALRSIERVLNSSPRWPPATKLQGRILILQGRLSEALEVLRPAVAERPADPEARFLLAEALTGAGFLDRAEQRLRETLVNDPAYLRIAGEAPKPLLELGHEEEFLALLPDPSDPHLAFVRGLALARLGREEEATEALTSALKTQPDHIFGRISLALAASLEGDIHEAAAVVEGLSRELEMTEAGGFWINFRLAQVAAHANLPELALRQTRLAIEKGFACGECLRNDPWFSKADARTAFQELIRVADAQQELLEPR